MGETPPPSHDGALRAFEGACWFRAREAARQLAPPDKWRERLAVEIRNATGARFAAVFTCPPGEPFAAHVAIVPEAAWAIVEEVHSRFLARVERSGNGMAVAATLGTRAYAPFLVTRSRALVSKVRREVLAPRGIEGLLNAFLLTDAPLPVGWLCIGTRENSREALRRFGEPLSEVAREASNTLSLALGLARACGGVIPPLPADDLQLLSPREQQIATLVASGLSDANVGARLSLSEETVGAHLRRIYRKLDVHSRIELTARVTNLEGRVATLPTPLALQRPTR